MSKLTATLLYGVNSGPLTRSFMRAAGNAAPPVSMPSLCDAGPAVMEDFELPGSTFDDVAGVDEVGAVVPRE